MFKLSNVLGAVVIVFIALAGPAFADWDSGIQSGIYSTLAPDTSRVYIFYCTVEWHNLVPDGKALVCPSGDGSYMHVVLEDQFHTPMSYILITADFQSNCDICLCSPVQGTTDYYGEVDLPIHGSVDLSGGPACCPVTTRLAIFSVNVYSEEREWLSPDLDGDCTVSMVDNAILGGDMGTTACRSDFNGDGIVNTDDSDIFLFHLLFHGAHSCGPTDVGKTTWGAIKSLYR